MTKFAKGNTRGAKLSNEQVFEIRRLYNEGASQAQLSRDFGVVINTVGRIVRGESRQAVPMALSDADHTEAKRRLESLQTARGDAAVERLGVAVQKAFEKEVKPERELDKLTDYPAAERFGITKG